MRKNPISKIMQKAAVATGNGTAIDCSEYATAGVQVVGITTATITWEVSNNDGTTWVGILGAPTTTGTGALTATADGIYIINVAGIQRLRARISAWSSGTITVTAFLKEA